MHQHPKPASFFILHHSFRAALRSLSSLARVILERTRRISCDGCSKCKHTLCLLLWEKGDRLRWMRSWLYFARINNRELFAHHQESDKEQLASDLRRSSFNKANASSVCLWQPPSPTGEGKLKRPYSLWICIKNTTETLL